MATVPLSGTNIRLLNEVPFSNDYKNTRWFDDVTSQTTYFQNKPIVHSISDANFQRIEGKHFISVNASIDELWGTNYLMFQNAQYNNKWFYAFVTKLEYVQRKTTYVHFQIDVFQTWLFQMRFKDSYVMREHARLWNEDGTPIIQTVDEGLDYGSVYETVSVENYVPYGDIRFLVVVSKSIMHIGDSEPPKTIRPMLNGSPQPLSYYVHPFKLDGTSPTVMWNGVAVDISPIDEVLKALYTVDDAVNNIVSLYVTEYFGDAVSHDEATDTLTFNNAKYEHRTIQEVDGVSINTLYVKILNSYNVKLKGMGDKYAGYNPVTESKLLMYPYTVLVLDDFKGNRIEFKNEYIDSEFINLTVRGSLGTSNKVAYSIDQYLTKYLPLSNDKTIVSLENALINNSPNDVPIITDMLAAYLQGNRNSIENQKNSIMFNSTMNAVGGGIAGVASAVTRNPIGVLEAGANIVQGAGNGVLQLQGIEAKQQDIDNTPPSITKMGSNTAFDYGNDYSGLFVIKKQITAEYRNKLTDFFHMFGYKIGRVKQPNFHTRQHFNYVQTQNCTITGNFNNEDLNELKAVFDNGITLWHTDDVGNYALENGVI